MDSDPTTRTSGKEKAGMMVESVCFVLLSFVIAGSAVLLLDLGRLK